MKKIILSILVTFLLCAIGTAFTAGPAMLGGLWKDNGDGTISPADSSKSVAMSKPYLDGTGKTALTSADSNGIYTEALAGTSPFVRTIPAPAESLVGVNFSFLQTGTTTYQVDPAGGQFRGLYSTNANGDKLQSDNVSGSILNVVCVLGEDGVTYYWFTSGGGVWSDAD